MTAADLLTKGRALSDEDRMMALRKLLLRDEAPALFAWLEDYHLKSFVTALGSQQMAAHHGCLEHCAGSIHAVQKIQEELAQLLVPPAPRRPRPD
jgi:hypothetical protein